MEVIESKEKILYLTLFALLLASGCVQEQGTLSQNQTIAEENDTFTLEEVSKHNSSDDCWMIFDDKVYEVTGFIPMHPGGEAILQGCGKDATTLFETRPMGSGTPHSQNARDKRETYWIGDID